MDSASWPIFGAILGAVFTAGVTGIVVWAQLGAASKERLEAIYERLLSDLDSVVREMGGWDGDPAIIPDHKKRTISRMLHLHLDNLVESIALEGTSRWLGFWYTLLVAKCWYIKVGRWFLNKHRYRRFEDWYAGISVLYNGVLEAPKYVGEVFHPVGASPDLHSGTQSLKDYFEKRLDYERG